MKLKYLKYLSLFFLLICSCNPGAEQTTVEYDAIGSEAVIEFSELEHDFGIVTEGEKVGWYFEYKNVGDSDLLISNVITTCGCTAPHYSKKPLPAGGEEVLQIIFDSNGKNGKEIKNVKIESNAKNGMVNLKLIFEVIN